MSQGLVELRRLLLKGTGRQFGTVVEVADSRVSVATTNGVKILPNPANILVVAGDRVVYEGDSLIGRVSANKIPVYNL